MNLFDKVQGFSRSPHGMEEVIWRRLPGILLWGTMLPLVVILFNHALAPDAPWTRATEQHILLWDYTMFGLLILHWTLVLTVGIGCIVVRIMKGPAYVADAYTIPQPDREPNKSTVATNDPAHG